MTFEDTSNYAHLSEACDAMAKSFEETPTRAAERIWGGAKGDPVETMKRMDVWAREDVNRVLAIVGPHWQRCLRAFLGGSKDSRHTSPYPKCGTAFRAALRRKEIKTRQSQQTPFVKAWQTQRVENAIGGMTNGTFAMQEYRRRKKAGIIVKKAEIELSTGKVSLIDHQYKPFAHIKINGLRLPEVTTEAALTWCDRQTTDVRFVRILCGLIPDPRKPIGEQWTAEIIREARQIAEKQAA